MQSVCSVDVVNYSLSNRFKLGLAVPQRWDKARIPIDIVRILVPERSLLRCRSLEPGRGDYHGRLELPPLGQYLASRILLDNSDKPSIWINTASPRIRNHPQICEVQKQHHTGRILRRITSDQRERFPEWQYIRSEGWGMSPRTVYGFRSLLGRRVTRLDVSNL